MRITESKLRQVIRQVIIESKDNEQQNKELFSLLAQHVEQEYGNAILKFVPESSRDEKMIKDQALAFLNSKDKMELFIRKELSGEMKEKFMSIMKK